MKYLTLALLCACSAPPRPGFLELLPDGPLLIAHRGGAITYPEETLYAFEQAWSVDGADVLELDVYRSTDDVLVVHHDELLDRTTNGTGPIADHNLAELQVLDAAYWWDPEPDDGTEEYPLRSRGHTIPSLREVLEALPHAPINIEIKPDDLRAADLLLDLLRETDSIGRTCIGSFHDGVTVYLRKLLPSEGCLWASQGQATCMVTSALLPLDQSDCEPGHILELPVESAGIRVATHSYIRRMQGEGIPVYWWTINDSEEMQFLLDAGVDGIMTDRTDLLRSLMP